MNAHADMFIIVGHNDLNTPRSIYRSLVSGVRKFPVFKSPKQALINAFYNMSANFWFATAKLLHFFELRKKIAKFLQIIVKIVRLNIVR